MKIDEIILGGTKKRLHRDPRKRRQVHNDNLYDVNPKELDEEVVDEIIRKMGDKYRLYSKKGKNLGTYDSRSGAEKREKQVNYFKHIGEATEIEFVCVNPEFCDATDPKNQEALFQALKQVPGIIVYRQDFEVHNSMAAILKSTADRNTVKQIKQLAKKHNVGIDLENNVSNKFIDSLYTDSTPNLIDWYDSDYLNEGYNLQLERDPKMYVLHVTDTKTGKRTEVRGKSDYETTGYDANDKLHQLLDKLGKSANFAELMNGEVVTINPKHPHAAKAQVATDVAFNEETGAEMLKIFRTMHHDQEPAENKRGR